MAFPGEHHFRGNSVNGYRITPTTSIAKLTTNQMTKGSWTISSKTQSSGGNNEEMYRRKKHRRICFLLGDHVVPPDDLHSILRFLQIIVTSGLFAFFQDAVRYDAEIIMVFDATGEVTSAGV